MQLSTPAAPVTRIVAITLLALAGCTSVTPRYDSQFGHSLRQASAAQTINPTAGTVPDLAAGIDGKAARETMLLYQGSYRSPPPVVNVINIGGRIGSAAGAGTGTPGASLAP